MPTTPPGPRSATPTATFVALLRGVNVGGNNRVPMADLRAALTGRGLTDVRTFIASGNVLFTARDHDDAPAEIAATVSDVLATRFAVRNPVLVLTARRLRSIAAAVPDVWADDPDLRCDVLFLFDDVDDADTLDRLPLTPGVDTAAYTPGAVVWMVPRALARRTGMTRIVGTPLYYRITVRNARTTRTLARMLDA